MSDFGNVAYLVTYPRNISPDEMCGFSLDLDLCVYVCARNI